MPAVETLMTEPVLRVDRDEPPGDLTEAMVELDIKSVLVTDDDCRPEGIITSTDYLCMIDEGIDPDGTTVEAFMTTDTVTVEVDTPVQEAAERMVDRGIGHLPVVDGDGRAVGIVSATDLTTYVAEGCQD